MNPFQSLRNYEEYVYTLAKEFPTIQRSTLVLIRRGQHTAILQGEIAFSGGYRISLRERLSTDTGLVVIEDYGYELWHDHYKLAWYDAQPHPNDPNLAATFPHHKHIHPDIKHHRIPAFKMSFSQPNLPALIGEIEELIDQDTKQRP